MLGQQFLRNYYVVLNYTSLQVGIAASATPPTINYEMPILTILGITFGSALIAIGLLVVVFKLKLINCCAKKKMKRAESEWEV